MKFILCLTMIMMGISCNAKTCNIMKDTDRFMWFLSIDDIAHYDRKHLKTYLSSPGNASFFSDTSERIVILDEISLKYNYIKYGHALALHTQLVSQKLHRLYCIDHQQNIWVMMELPFGKTEGAYAMYSLLLVFLGMALLKRSIFPTRISHTTKLINRKVKETAADVTEEASTVEMEKKDAETLENVNRVKAPDVEFLKKLDNLIEENLVKGSKITVALMFKGMGMSRTSFYNKVMAVTHQRPNEYIKKYLMGKAALLLLAKEDMRIMEVADAIGYADSKYFRTEFKKFHGLSPSDYKKLHRNGANMNSDLQRDL